MYSIPELGKKFEVTIVNVFDLGLIVESNEGDTYQLRVPELTDRFQVLDRESRLKEVIGKTIFVYEFVEAKGHVSQLSESELKHRADMHKKRMIKAQQKYSKDF